MEAGKRKKGRFLQSIGNGNKEDNTISPKGHPKG